MTHNDLVSHYAIMNALNQIIDLLTLMIPQTIDQLTRNILSVPDHGILQIIEITLKFNF
jgi:hypothetical protein